MEGDIPVPWGGQTVLVRALQKSAGVPSKEVHKITVAVSVIKGSHSHKYSV